MSAAGTPKARKRPSTIGMGRHREALDDLDAAWREDLEDIAEGVRHRLTLGGEVTIDQVLDQLDYAVKHGLRPRDGHGEPL